jgi:hypothetical protein
MPEQLMSTTSAAYFASSRPRPAVWGWYVQLDDESVGNVWHLPRVCVGVHPEGTLYIMQVHVYPNKAYLCAYLLKYFHPSGGYTYIHTCIPTPGLAYVLHVYMRIYEHACAQPHLRVGVPEAPMQRRRLRIHMHRTRCSRKPIHVHTRHVLASQVLQWHSLAVGAGCLERQHPVRTGRVGSDRAGWQLQMHKKN